MTEKDPRPRPPLATRLITLGALFQRPMTLGVRGLVIDPAGKVLLVRHTYLPGFYLPGGGVERGETLIEAMTRELAEEGNIVVEETPTLHGVYLNRAASSRDHVALYVVRSFRQSGPHVPGLEIAEAKFFSPDALPDDATRATRERLAEVLRGTTVSSYW